MCGNLQGLEALPKALDGVFVRNVQLVTDHSNPRAEQLAFRRYIDWVIDAFAAFGGRVVEAHIPSGRCDVRPCTLHAPHKIHHFAWLVPFHTQSVQTNVSRDQVPSQVQTISYDFKDRVSECPLSVYCCTSKMLTCACSGSESRQAGPRKARACAACIAQRTRVKIYTCRQERAPPKASSSYLSLCRASAATARRGSTLCNSSKCFRTSLSWATHGNTLSSLQCASGSGQRLPTASARTNSCNFGKLQYHTYIAFVCVRLHVGKCLSICKPIDYIKQPVKSCLKM